MPPPAPSFFGTSATIASVVMSRPAIDAAFCSAARTTLVGSMMPFFIMSHVFAGLRVEAVAVLILLEDLADDDRAVLARIEGDLAGRSRERLADDLDAGLLVVVAGAELAQAFAGAEQGDAAARQDAFLDRGAGRMHRVIDAILALLHLDLGRAADADHRDAARELGQTLLQLLAVVVGGGLLDLRLDLGDAAPRCRPSCRRR